MAEDGANPFERGQLRREATEWFIRMRDEDADQWKPAFEAWLARGPFNRAAYNRVANLYGAGKNVDWDNLPPPRPVRGAVKLTILGAVGALLLASFVLWKLLIAPLMTTGVDMASTNRKPMVAQSAQLISRLGQIRQVTLPDGSHLVLDTDTLVTTNFRGDERELRLEHGRARFEVAHERRPFVVDAGAGQVIAHGTIFDVSLEHAGVHVALLRGSVEVRMLPAVKEPIPARSTRLKPGEEVEFANSSFVATPPRPILQPAQNWPSGFMEFDNVPLATVVEQANRYSLSKIVLSDPSLGQIKISGTFRVDDGEILAAQVANLLGLSLAHEPGFIILVAAQK